MGRPEIKIPAAPYVYGGNREQLCRECGLPCGFEETSPDCFRRFFLQGMLKCTYLVYGYCFLDRPGCVFDNGADHDKYWLGLLNEYFHNVTGCEESDEEFARHRDEVARLVDEHIAARQVSLCRYFEEFYNGLLEDGGGVSEEVMGRFDDAYLALLSGTSRKR